MLWYGFLVGKKMINTSLPEILLIFNENQVGAARFRIFM